MAEADTRDDTAKPDERPATADVFGGQNATVDKIFGNAEKISTGLAATNKEYGTALDRTAGAQLGNFSRMEKLAEQQFKHSGAQIDELKSLQWNGDEQSRKYATDPLAAFGSLGSVLGILASSFTHAPLTASLEASAAAMNAVKAGDEKTYERAYKSWQENTKLTVDRLKMEREHFKDAMELLKTNMAAGEAKMRVLAARFDNKKLQVLLDNGMAPETLEYLGKMFGVIDKYEDHAAKAFERLDSQMLIGMMSKNGFDPTKPPGDPQNVEAFEKTKEWQAKIKRESSPYGLGASSLSRGDAAEVDRRTSEYEASGLSHNEARDKARAEVAGSGKAGGVGATNLTADRQRAQDVAGIVKEYQKEHPDASAEEVAKVRADTERRLKTAAAAPSGNRIDDLKGKRNQVGLANTTIDHIEEMLKKHNAITGLGGKVTRPGEVVSNIFGSNETDRKQFERWVAELQEIAPRILLDSKGRPLSSEAGRVETIIAGLRLGDTTANTARAYYEFKKVLKQIDTGLAERAGDEGSAKKETSSAKSWYEQAPAAGQ